MAVDDKYKMFHNYMHNELGITKEDIKQWTKEAVTEVAKNYVERQFHGVDLNKIVAAQMQPTPYGKSPLKDAIIETLANKITFYIKQ